MLLWIIQPSGVTAIGFECPMPITTVVLAMSADGKIADAARSPALFGSPADKAHLEYQVALADGILSGAGTLRAGGTAMRVVRRKLIQARERQGKPPQPVQIICSRTGNIDPQLRFFRQPIPRWLLSTAAGAKLWQEKSVFERVMAIENSEGEIDLPAALSQLALLGIERLAVLGGGELVASLLAADSIDEIWLTVCPLILGGKNAPTPVDGIGFPANISPRLELLEVKPVGDEVFLHYRLKPKEV